MNVKRFVAPDMRRALKLVREELGDDALILSNKPTADGIEVIASTEEITVESNASSQSAVPSNSVPSNSVPSNSVSSPQQVAMNEGGANHNSNVATQLTQISNSEINRNFLKKQAEQLLQTDQNNLPSRVKQPSRNPHPSPSPLENKKGKTDLPKKRKEEFKERKSDFDLSVANRNLRDNKEIARLTLELEEAKRALENAESKATRLDSLNQNQPDNTDNVSPSLQREFPLQSECLSEQSDDWIAPNDLFVDAPREPLKREPLTGEPFNNQPRAMEAELKQLRDLLTLQMGEAMWGNFSYKKPVQAQLLKKLRVLGLTNELCKRVVDVVGEEGEIEAAWRRALVKITKRIPIPKRSIVEEGGVISLVGPTGAGKTTTIAKIAASYVLKYGPQDLAIVTTDTYRIGAHEQLKTLGRILSVPVHIVNNENNLNGILQQLSHKHLVLVDTAGLTRGESARQDQLQQLHGCKARVRNFLVLATTNQLRVQRAAVKDFESLSLCGCILTKLDETSSLGESISVLLENKLPVAYLTNGQKIPDDIQVATAPKLVSTAVSMMDESDVDEMTMSSLIGALGVEAGLDRQADSGSQSEMDLKARLRAAASGQVPFQIAYA